MKTVYWNIDLGNMNLNQPARPTLIWGKAIYLDVIEEGLMVTKEYSFRWLWFTVFLATLRKCPQVGIEKTAELKNGL